LRSEKDTVATALQKMLEMNNRVFSRIHAAAGQVADSSRQIANVSQNLAQGSSEQAGTVEELSVSISAVTENARENADMANKAAALSDSTRGKAEEGSRQMKDLKIAVNEINEAGKDIAGVIKVIEDIAFQTNILALNAAVEAARAGAYGKGFAVVAEEVRNLAGKSAEAAKNTGSMINNSIEKAKLGADIAADTAASLEEIVKGINENSRMVGKIADSSAEASDAIEKINVGIEQMTRVVQQNSATAEESAAAGEEMSGQSELLLSLVSGFRLKDAALGISENSGRLLRSP
jgi:methyl-accepting chemotaxis protein